MSENHSKKIKSKQVVNINWRIPVVTLIIFIAIFSLSLVLRKDKEVDLGSQVPTPTAEMSNDDKLIKLPDPAFRSSFSVEAALKAIRPKRSFSDEMLSLKVVSQLLWSAQGVNVDWGDRTTPSAKSTYPLSVFLISNNIEGINSGLYQYIPGERERIHTLKPLTRGEYQTALYSSLNQNSMKNPAGVILITGNMAKMAQAYGGIAHDKEVYLEAGHAAQNLYLQAESLKLGLVALSNFEDSIIRNIINLPGEETLIYIIPFGQIKD